MSNYNPPKYRILNKINENNKHDAIEFIDGKYEGLVFSYGRVELVEDDIADELIAKFEYDVHHQPLQSFEETELISYLGDFLIFLIEKQAEAGELVYAGGTDVTKPMRDDE